MGQICEHTTPYFAWADGDLNRRIVLLILFTFSSACTSSFHRFDDPVAVMLDRESDWKHRRIAAQQAEHDLPHDEYRLRALRHIAWGRGFPSWQRLYAAEQLITFDRDRLREVLGRQLEQIDDPVVFRSFLKMISDEGWIGTTPAVVRSYARPSQSIPDRDRPERATLLTLHTGQAIDRILFDIFENSAGQFSAIDQAAAWEVLVRLVPKATLIDMIARADGASAILLDIKMAVAQLKVLPRNREGLLWLAHLRSPSETQQWHRLTGIVSRLNDEQLGGLSLRHLQLLTHLGADELTATRAVLLERASRVIGWRRHGTGAEVGVSSEYPQGFDDWADDLSWGDLQILLTISRSLCEKVLIDQLFAQADIDLEDAKSEHGGLFIWSGGRIEPQAYEPLMRVHDAKYLPHPQMILDMYASLAHYHFHAQRHLNHDHACPGRGDRALIDHLNPSGLVFTFVGRDKLNVDYYQPGGVVIDLGVIER